MFQCPARRAAGIDPDVGDVLHYSATGLPEGATLDADSGLVTWTPGPAQAGDYVVRFTAGDGVLSTSQSIWIHAAVTPTPPSVGIVLTPSFPVKPGSSVLVHVIADSLADITGLTVTVDGQPAHLLRCNYIMRGVYLTPGRHSIEFRFRTPRSSSLM